MTSGFDLVLMHILIGKYRPGIFGRCSHRQDGECHGARVDYEGGLLDSPLPAARTTLTMGPEHSHRAHEKIENALLINPMNDENTFLINPPPGLGAGKGVGSGSESG